MIEKYVHEEKRSNFSIAQFLKYLTRSKSNFLSILKVLSYMIVPNFLGRHFLVYKNQSTTYLLLGALYISFFKLKQDFKMKRFLQPNHDLSLMKVAVN